MTNPWTNVYGVARTILAFGLLSQLLANNVDVLFSAETFKVLRAGVPASRLSLFNLLSGSHLSLECARWIAIGILGVVASGWRPRLTGIFHWWVSVSFAMSTAVPEGGDQICANLSLILLPVTLSDPRRWHWATLQSRPASIGDWCRIAVASSCITVGRIQVAGIYFDAAISKIAAPEWADGTALYYWFTHPVYGMSEPGLGMMMPLLVNPWSVTLMTWSVIGLELLLAAALVMDRRHYRKLLIPGLAFHAGIVVAHGLVSFFFAMAGALVWYLRPREQPFSAGTMRQSMAWLGSYVRGIKDRLFAAVRITGTSL